MTFSSCLTDKDDALVLDASVVINLLNTDYSTPILKALTIPIFVASHIVDELKRGVVKGRQESDLLTRMIDERVVGVVELRGNALVTFADLVSGKSSDTLGDGEAATLAIAHEMSCAAAIDERKAMRIAAERLVSLRLVSTVDILAHGKVRASLGDANLAEATLGALRQARMQVRESQFDWVVDVIGAKNVGTCPSLKRIAKNRAGVPKSLPGTG
ncbi:MAG: hypothetical protein FWD68_18000 [Alphaproteobacteria bacterium]|nr:hypothetical protein [Alphaproteobacteria bacterium]